jgi:hypothetical protein
LASMLRSLMVAIMAEKQKIIFRLDNGAYFSVLPFSPSPWSNDKVIVQGKSGQPLERQFTRPLACSWGDLLFCHPFPHSSWNSSDSAGTRFTISTKKNHILLPPGSYFCCSLFQEQIESTMWTDEMSIGQAWTALPIQIKLKNPSQFPHPKQYPLKPLWGTIRPYAYHKFLKKQGLLISCSSPYNKFKILIKVNFKIQVTK